MIKILYDHQMFSMQKFGGVTRYFADLIFNLPQDFEKEVAIFRKSLYNKNIQSNIQNHRFLAKFSHQKTIILFLQSSNLKKNYQRKSV